MLTLGRNGTDTSSTQVRVFNIWNWNYETATNLTTN